MSSESDDPIDPELLDENIINILVACDINLGYEQTVQRDQEDDSFRTFEEILRYANENDADAILLGGNLFYEANPPLNVLTRCISLLRTYCLNKRTVQIDCITDAEWVFNHCDHKIVNFKDPNLKIGTPIFSIYGHRDAPLLGPVGPLDLLAATGLVNYFGKWDGNSEMSIPPLLLRKGSTTLALYGLNYMNNDRLSKLLKKGKFELLRDESIQDICNVMILHQPRTRQVNSDEQSVGIEDLLPDFLNLILWGHEPACKIEHESFPGKTFRISQPGSTIATSLSRGEAISKKVALLRVYKDSFQMKCLPLKTVRPFVYDQIALNEYEEQLQNLQRQLCLGRTILRNRKEAIEKLLDSYIQEVLLPRARQQLTGHPEQPKKPLLRLRVILDESYQFNRLSSKYENDVANPGDMIFLSKYHLQPNDLDGDLADDAYRELSKIFSKNASQNWIRTVEGGMSEHYQIEENKKKLTVLPLENLNKGMTLFKKGDSKIFHRIVRAEIEQTVEKLMEEDEDWLDATEAVQNFEEI